MIASLLPNQVFIFGSNMAGKHYGGAAKQAADQFGAQYGVGEGLTGQCYAFPTLTADFKKVSNTQLHASRLRLYETANAHPETEFLLTKVGCGIAGFTESKMRRLFVNAPSNVVKPEDWR